MQNALETLCNLKHSCLFDTKAIKFISIFIFADLKSISHVYPLWFSILLHADMNDLCMLASSILKTHDIINELDFFYPS